MGSKTVQLLASQTAKIDNLAVNGLLGVSGSLAYKVHEIERHIHSFERWLGAAASASGETHVADSIGSGVSAFRIDAGNNDWGSWVQIVGSADTPRISGNLKFDGRQIMIESHERNTQTYFIQIAYGASGAAALAAGDYTEIGLISGGGTSEVGPIDLQDRRFDVGIKVWVRAFIPTINTGTIDFYLGLHEYEA